MEVILAENTREILKKWQADESTHVRNRANIILMTAEGKAPEDISAELKLGLKTVNKWLEAWEQKGLKIFQDNDHGTTETEAVVVPPTFTPKSILVDADDMMAEAGRKILEYNLSAMLFYEDIARTGEHAEGVHKMRVATRRMRSAHRAFKPYLNKTFYKGITKPLRQTAQTLGVVRDMDVFLIKTQHYVDTQLGGDETALIPMLDTLREEYVIARHELVKWLDSKNYSRFKEHFQAILEQPITDAKMAVQVKYVAPELIYARQGAVRRYENVLHELDLETLHQLRVEFKRLRYALEAFESVLGQAIKDYMSHVKHMQEALGDLNDAVVALEIIDHLYKRIPKSDREGVKAYRQVRHDEMTDLLDRFPELWANFNRLEVRQSLASALASL